MTGRPWRRTGDYTDGYNDGLTGAPADPDRAKHGSEYSRGYTDGRADAGTLPPPSENP